MNLKLNLHKLNINKHQSSSELTKSLLSSSRNQYPRELDSFRQNNSNENRTPKMTPKTVKDFQLLNLLREQEEIDNQQHKLCMEFFDETKQQKLKQDELLIFKQDIIQQQKDLFSQKREIKFQMIDQLLSK